MGANGPLPITVEAMDAYSRLTNRRDREYLDQMVMFVPLLDREYLKDFYDKQAKEMDKARRKNEQAAGKQGLGRRAAPQRRK